MLSTFVLRPVARTLAVALLLADTVLTTRTPPRPDWDDAGTPARP
ncbi:hypothetical protein [Rhodococcus ruber]|nr:hypothetical protein [Rhodococcus ruber]AXY49298.1 hypothetical protein YT1_p10097 [Rhodococcus ruber]